MPFIEAFTGLLQVLVDLVQAVAWPLLVLAIFIYLREPLRKLVSEAREASLKAGPGGLEATISRGVKAATRLSAAKAQKAGITPEIAPEQQREEIDEAIAVINQTAVPNIEQLEKASLLWVDDHPENNFYEREMLAALGIQVTRARSTETALVRLREHPYDVIVSDMGRGEEALAGYTLLQKLREQADRTPFIIYSSTATETQRAETRQRGGFGQTSNPAELLRMVTAAIVGGTP